MSTSSVSGSVIRFGVFEVDLRTGELRKSGVRIRLQKQPLQVLQVLLEHRGDIVSREQLRAQLWGKDVFVDFDRALNRAIVKLREALGDLAESPRFIETLPRIGYRFIAPIENLPDRAQVTSSLSPAGESRARRYRLLWALALLSVVSLLVARIYRTKASAGFRVVNVTELSRSREPKIPPVLSDGTRLYFGANFEGEMRVTQLSTIGGEAVPIATSLNNIMLFDISPRKSELLAGRVKPYDWPPPLWILPVLGGAPHTVGNLRAEAAAWMPDGNRILFAAGDTLYVTDINGNRPEKFLTAAGRITSPAWSPDGKRLRFGVHLGGNSVGLWEADTDGGSLHPLLPGWNKPSNECCGRWTQDGRYYIFQSTRSGRTDLWALREYASASGSRAEPMRLTNGPLNMLAPFPDSDRGRIYAMGQQEVGELVRYDSVRREFVPFLNGISAEGVSFSRDGNWVTYVSYPDGVLWRSRTDGSEKLQLTEPPLSASVPIWSPDRKYIAFVGSGATDPVWQIYLVSSEGSNLQQLTFGNADQFSPWWSPDGSRLVYSRHSWTNTSISMLELQNKKVTNVPGSEGLCCPTWSRDGGHIFAAGSSPPRSMMYDFATSKWTELWRGVFDYYDMSHDGAYLYFDSVWERDPGVYRLRIRDHKLEKVVSLENFRRTRGLNGYWFDISPDDSPLLLRNLSTEQVYELDVQSP